MKSSRLQVEIYDLYVKADSCEISAGGDSLDNCKDVDVLPEYSASTMSDLEMVGDCRLKENSLVHSRFRKQEGLPMDYDGVSVSSSIFEFQKAERAQQRLPVAPFSKPAPSKWDDAQKWIASPTSNRTTGGQAKSGTRKAGLLSYGSRQSSLKVVTEVPDQRTGGLGEPDTKRIDTSQASKEGAGSKFVSWQVDMHPIADLYGRPVLMVENSIAESTGKDLVIRLTKYSSSSFGNGMCLCWQFAYIFYSPYMHMLDDTI